VQELKSGKEKNIKARKDTSHRADPDFNHRVGENEKGKTLKYCYQCGRCTSSCPIAKLIDIYRPNQIIKLAKLGIRDLPQSSAYLFCSACTLCTKCCPQKVKVHDIMQALKDEAGEDSGFGKFISGRFEEVLEKLGQKMPFPIVYSWICFNTEGEVDPEILSIFDRALARPVETPDEESFPELNNKNVAIIGAGPAGLTAAWNLARAGIAVTVFENLSEPGGMLKAGIPEYRLPKNIVDTEIEKIKSLGVEIRTSTAVDKDFFNDLVQNYSAVFIATGAFVSRKLRVEGEDLQGVVSALEFLKEYNMKGKVNNMGKKAVVIGGGNVAIDAAGAAIRCGAESVKLFCLEDRENMPAHDWEIQAIVSDGVEINPSWGPKIILGTDGKVTGIEFVFCKSVFDENKRFSPKFDEKKTLQVEADTIITAIGQAPDISFLGGDIDSVRGIIQVDPYTMETSLPNVFAGGDSVKGTASLIEAITTGNTAAESIIEYLRGSEK